jgi:hypothetical protein
MHSRSDEELIAALTIAVNEIAKRLKEARKPERKP